MILDDESGLLYIADTGNQRILKFNTNSGNFDYNLTPYGENLAQYWMMENAEWDVYISEGLDKPSGIDLFEDRLVVGDYASGMIVIYDISTNPPVALGSIDTGNENNIMGIKIGPDQKIWYVNYERDEVIRIDYNILPGDVNYDESVDILDVILVVNILLGTLDPTQAEWSAANVNGDSVVNILDIILIINIILGN
jgi:WD40 repeat protein